ncbi:distal membrane-arm assembly complex protein 2-like isoform X1 [Portunus trituberculatus]|nr:distal membrane-arm assembly complex protein 2-like isoform X1 [Portunus trituberculatus]XP_045115872.1 distal membrane-arm assembly complex protein 2-like isoform X1 [Portunus trituberculatus]
MSVACRWTRRLCGRHLTLNRGMHSSAVLSNKEDETPKKVWVTHHREGEKMSWNVPSEPVDVRQKIPDNEWRGLLHRIAPKKPIRADFMSYMQRGIDLRPSSIKRWWGNMQTEAAAKDQMYKPERVAVLGFELAAAHFVVHRGGRVRFRGVKEWVEQNEDEEYELSRHYQPGVYIEEVDASKINLVYEGLESMKNLMYLKNLSVSGCAHIDDWCIDRICCQFSGTLEHLDISGCTKVTERGIGALARLRQLRTLNITGLDGVKDIRLLCLLLKDDLPQLKISGINYFNPETLEHS